MLSRLAAADVVIASRMAPGAQVLGTQPALRGVMGRVFNGVVQLIALPGLADTQCGFKGFRAAAARTIFAEQTIDRFGFDVEVLYLARRHGYRIEEMPVVCTYHAGSSVNRVDDVLGMLADLLRIRWRHR
jgi:dolichyl-phosphate beta-glucosyltransferase